MDASNMRLIGRHDLGGGKMGEGIGLRAAAGRRTLYLAHETGPPNFTVVDVTDPREPQVVTQTTLAEEGLRSNSLAVCGDLMLVCYQEAGTWRGPRRMHVGLEVFDLSDPHDPRSIGFWSAAGPPSRGTHCVWFVDGRRAYLSTGTADSRPTNPKDDQFAVILDLSDPGRPQEVGRWWLPGTQEGDAVEPLPRHEQFDAGYRTHNVNVYPQRPDRAYVAYLDGGLVILDIADPARPRLVSRLDYHPGSSTGFTHTVVPLFARGLAAVTDESVHEGGADWPRPLWLMDIADEASPSIVAQAPLPVVELRSLPGRMGAHNLHENDPIDVAWRSEEVLVGAFFNGGVRAYDIRDASHPRELGHLIPDPPERSHVGAAQVNDVFVDENRVIYAVERFGGGLYVLEADF